MLRRAGVSLRSRFATVACVDPRCETLIRSAGVLVFGSDAISVTTYKALHRNIDTKLIERLEVLCPPDRPAGRHLRLESVPLKKAALQDGVTVHYAPADWADWKVPATATGPPFNMAVVVSFGHLIPTHVLEAFQYRMINMHPSLLPRYRGAAPIHHSILNRDTETGVSIIQLSANKFDAGKILLQRAIPVPPDITYQPLAEQLAQLGATSVVDVLQDFSAKLQNAKLQDESRVTKAPKVHKDDGILRFDLNAQEAYTRWRAYGDNVGIFAWAGNKRVRFLNLSVAAKCVAKSAGGLSFLKEQRLLHVGCADGTAVNSNLVQVAGKEAQSAADFANGYLRNGATLQLSSKDPSARA